MARDDPHFRLRLPETLKSQVEDSAQRADRSITAEIVRRLELSFSDATSDGPPDPIRTIERMFAAFSPTPPTQEAYLRALQFHLKLEEAALEQAARMKEAEAGGEMWPTWMSRFFLVERIKQRIRELEA